MAFIQALRQTHPPNHGLQKNNDTILPLSTMPLFTQASGLLQTANITKQALERMHINLPIQTKTKSYSPLTHSGPPTRNRIPLSGGQVRFTNRTKPEFRIHRPNNNLAQSTYGPPLSLRSQTQDSRSLSPTWLASRSSLLTRPGTKHENELTTASHQEIYLIMPPTPFTAPR
jgi:hypothetical protein